MNSRSATARCSSDEALDQVLDEITARLQAGESLDVETCVAAHPQYADRLRRLLPAMQILAAVGGSPASGAAGPPREPIDAPAGLLGDFRIVREIGRGGMGVVYEAEQISIGRSVALKVLPFASMVDERRLARFRNEVRAAGQLHHTNIVPIYAVGADRGVHFFAMQLIDGQTVAEMINDLRGHVAADNSTNDAQSPASWRAAAAETERAALSTIRNDPSASFCRTAAQLAAHAAEALEHAHAHGVIHRDIKPSNLMVDGRGTLYLTDFGLASMETDSNLTMTGDLLGTLRYMSPEQTRGARVVLDHRTDVYSLGVTLYELLTLELAFDAPDRQQLMRLINDEEPRPPRRLNSAIPADLETIVLKAMAKEPSSRYATALDMADDLRRFLESKPIEARRPGLVERVRRWSRRHAALLSVGVAALAAVAVVGVIATALTLQAYRSEARQHAAADANLRVARDSIDRMLSRIADDRYFHGDLVQAESIAVDAAEFYDKLLAHSDDPNLHFHASRAQAKIADVWVLVGQHEQARQAYLRSIELVRPLIVAYPGEPQYLEARAYAYQGVGESQWRQYNVYESLEPFQQAAADYQLLVDRFPSEPAYRQGLANALTNVGLYSWISNQWEDAVGYYQRATELTNSLPPRVQQSPAGLTSRAGLLSNQALLARSRGDVARAEGLLADAVLLQQRSRDKWPENPIAADGLYRHYWNLGETSLGASRPEQAAQAVEMLIGAFPDRLEAYVDGARQLVVCGGLAEQAVWKGGGQYAGEYYQRAHELVEQAQEADERTPEAIERFAWFLLTCEVVSFRDPSLALELATGVVEDVPERGGAWFTLALAYYRSGDWQAAERASKNSVKLGALNKANAYDWVLLSMICSQQGRTDEAHQWLKKADDWMSENKAGDQVLLDLATEAGALLSVADEYPVTSEASALSH